MFQTCISMISTLMSSWARFRVFTGRFTCKNEKGGHLAGFGRPSTAFIQPVPSFQLALECLSAASANRRLAPECPVPASASRPAGTPVPSAQLLEPHSSVSRQCLLHCVHHGE